MGFAVCWYLRLVLCRRSHAARHLSFVGFVLPRAWHLYFVTFVLCWDLYFVTFVLWGSYFVTFVLCWELYFVEFVLSSHFVDFCYSRFDSCQIRFDSCQNDCSRNRQRGEVCHTHTWTYRCNTHGTSMGTMHLSRNLTDAHALYIASIRGA